MTMRSSVPFSVRLLIFVSDSITFVRVKLGVVVVLDIVVLLDVVLTTVEVVEVVTVHVAVVGVEVVRVDVLVVLLVVRVVEMDVVKVTSIQNSCNRHLQKSNEQSSAG